MVSAILLDLDGTLVDSAPELASAVNGGLAPLGRRSLTVAEVRGMIGDGIPTLTARALAATSGGGGDAAPGPVIEEVRRLYDLQPPSIPYAGVDETLRVLQRAGLALVVCTNKPEASARRLLEQLGWAGLLADIVGGDRTPHRKPHPDHLLVPLRRLGIPSIEAVMVGDGVNDARAARAANIPFIFAAYGYSVRPPGAAADSIARFDQLFKAVGAVATSRGRPFPPPAPAV